MLRTGSAANDLSVDWVEDLLRPPDGQVGRNWRMAFWVPKMANRGRVSPAVPFNSYQSHYGIFIAPLETSVYTSSMATALWKSMSPEIDNKQKEHQLSEFGLIAQGMISGVPCGALYVKHSSHLSKGSYLVFNLPTFEGDNPYKIAFEEGMSAFFMEKRKMLLPIGFATF